jgi:hypothetical protein
MVETGGVEPQGESLQMLPWPGQPSPYSEGRLYNESALCISHTRILGAKLK